MCYGENETGKSFTLFGDKGTPGIIQLTLETLFALIQITPNKEYLIRTSFFEIRNECIKDLCSNKEHLALIETDSGIRIKELTEIVCRDVLTGIELLNKRRNNTDLIYKLTVESKGMNEDRVTMSTINFIELADPSFKDEFDSNRSITCLNEIITKLVNNQCADFKRSKLTQYLQESLTGNAKIALICTISTAYTSYKKTKEALMFGRELSKLKMSPKKNVTDNLLESFLLQYKEQLSAVASNSLITHSDELKSAILMSGDNPLNDNTLRNSTANSLNSVQGRIQKRVKDLINKVNVVEKAKNGFNISINDEPELEETLRHTLVIAEKDFFQELIADHKKRLDVT